MTRARIAAAELLPRGRMSCFSCWSSLWRRRDAEQSQPMETMHSLRWAWLTHSRQKPSLPRNSSILLQPKNTSNVS